MNELPPFVYSKRFWEGVSYVLAGILWLLVYFGVLTPEWALAPTALLAIILAALKFIGVEPEVRLAEIEAKLAKTEKLLEQAIRVRNDLLAAKEQKEVTKTSSKSRK